MSDFTALETIFKEAAARGRYFLLEPEGYAFMRHLGIPVPASTVLGPMEPVTEAHRKTVPSEKAVLKVVSPSILHKTDVGGVAVIANTVRAVQEARDAMHAALCKQFPESAIEGYLLCEFIPYSKELGAEALVGCRLSHDFGPVVTYGYGGVETEFLAKILPPGQSVSIFSAFDGDAGTTGAVVDGANVSQKLLGRIRNQKPLARREDLMRLLEAFAAVAAHFSPHTPACPYQLVEWEVNPFIASGGRLVALDFLLTFATNTPLPPSKPVEKIRNLLLPATIAVMGASEKSMNG